VVEGGGNYFPPKIFVLLHKPSLLLLDTTSTNTKTLTKLEVHLLPHRGDEATMTTPADLPSLVSARVLASPDHETHGLRIKKGQEGAITIYHIEPDSAAAQSELYVGCEILSINDHRVASVEKCIEMLVYYLDKKGMADIVASKGSRPRGTSYVLVKNTKDKSIFDGGSDEIDGMQVEQKDGYVRIADTPTTGFFSKVRLRRGDCIWSIDGKMVQDIQQIRQEFKGAEGKIVYVLTYNSFRKLKSVVMTVSKKMGVTGKWQLGSGADTEESSRIEDVYNIHEKVRISNFDKFAFRTSPLEPIVCHYCFQLGEGAFAVVKRATHKKTGDVYAIKTVNRESLGASTEKALKDEISILTELDHKHIMNLHGVYCTISEYHLVTEYLEGGELFDRIVDKSSYTESEARDVCKILFGAMAFMEKKRIAHRDLKPENLLLQYKHSDSEIKIADFGFAKKAETEESLSTICGTPGYGKTTVRLFLP
jgi:hypothetical protein